jgi:tricarballylate dehydrogenase
MSAESIFDVLIVGEGMAGCCAAITARDLGARVLVLDKAPAGVPHGNTAYSGGAFRRVSGTYTRDLYFSDLMVLSDNRADPELAHFVVDRSAEAQLWLEQLGVAWVPSKGTSNRAVEALDRGRGLARAVRHAVVERAIPCLHEMEATSLLRAGGRVVGAEVRRRDGSGGIFKAGAVILACGGFSANPEMVRRYIGEGARHLVLRGSTYNTGDGVRMAEALGAKLDWMDDFHGGLIPYAYKEHREEIEKAGTGMRHIAHYEVAILVNQDGKRFVDEGEYPSDKTYAKFGKLVPLTQPGGIAYVVFDAQTRNIVDPVYTGPGSDPIEAPTLEALATKIDVPADALTWTVHEFNAGVRDGKNLTVTPPKTNFAQRIDTPPYYAHKVTGGFTFTFGGLRTKLTGEVQDTNGSPIPGLFAAGEITTGLFYGNYGGGSSLPKCAILGREAGRAAVEYATQERAKEASLLQP